jgi:hypothetical protein
MNETDFEFCSKVMPYYQRKMLMGRHIAKGTVPQSKY